MFAKLEHERNWVAMEATGVHMPDVPALLQRVLPEAREAFRGLVARFSPSQPGIPSLSSQEREFLASIKNAKYLDLAAILAYVPQGLKVTYLTYLSALGPVVERVSSTERMINTYNTYLAMLVTNADHRFSIKSSGFIYQELEASRAQFNKDLAMCFQNGSHITETKYSKVVDRNSDWELVFGSLHKLSTELNKVNRKVLENGIKESEHLLEKVAAMTKRGDLKDGSPEMVQEIADGAFQAASELEFYAVTVYRVLALTTAVNDTIEHVVKVRK